MFESDVILYSDKTLMKNGKQRAMFESDVILYSDKTNILLVYFL